MFECLGHRPAEELNTQHSEVHCSGGWTAWHIPLLSREFRPILTHVKWCIVSILLLLLVLTLSESTFSNLRFNLTFKVNVLHLLLWRRLLLFFFFILGFLPESVPKFSIDFVDALFHRLGWVLGLLFPHLLKCLLYRILHENVKLFRLAGCILLFLRLLLKGVSRFPCFFL